MKYVLLFLLFFVGCCQNVNSEQEPVTEWKDLGRWTYMTKVDNCVVVIRNNSNAAPVLSCDWGHK